MSGSRRRLVGVVASLVTLVACSLALLLGSGPGAAASGPTTSLTLQTMDSCKRALDGAGYQLAGGNLGAPLTVSSSGSALQTVSSGTCPVPRGNCSSTSVGCLTFTGIPVPGTSRITSIKTPPATSSNPQGYAPCEGGSACRSEEADVTVLGDGSVQATVTDVYPDATVRVFPGSGSTYAGTAGDPVVFHDFGLGSGSCDGDHDADDHLTGSPSTHCAYKPESGEASACPGGTDQTYPWSCPSTTTSTSTTSTGSTTSGSTTTTTSTSSTTSTTSSTTTTTTTTMTTTTTTTTTSTTTSTGSTTSTVSACPTQATQSFTGSASGTSSTSNFVDTTAAGPLSVSVTWTPPTTVDLIVYDGSLTVLGEQTGSSGSLSLTLANVPASSYKVKVKNTGSTSISFGLTVTHC